MNSELMTKEKRLQLARSLGSIWGISHTEEYEEIVGLLGQHVIPKQYPDVAGNIFGSRELSMDATVYRDQIITNCGFALLSYEWIRPLAGWIGDRKCLEIMAGSGALTYALSQCGTDIIATDNKSWHDPRCKWFTAPWTDVEQLDCLQAIQKYGLERPLIICSWPYMDDSAYRALMEMRKVNPAAVMLYIGEEECGATANEEFFSAVQEVDDQAFMDAVSNFKQMPGLHDWPSLLK